MCRISIRTRFVNVANINFYVPHFVSRPFHLSYFDWFIICFWSSCDLWDLTLCASSTLLVRNMCVLTHPHTLKHFVKQKPCVRNIYANVVRRFVKTLNEICIWIMSVNVCGMASRRRYGGRRGFRSRLTRIYSIQLNSHVEVNILVHIFIHLLKSDVCGSSTSKFVKWQILMFCIWHRAADYLYILVYVYIFM